MTDGLGNPVRVFDAAGNPAGAWGEYGGGPGQLVAPAGIAFGQARIPAADDPVRLVRTLGAAGVRAGAFAALGGDPVRSDDQINMALNATHVFVTDGLNHHIRVLGATGVHAGTLGAFGEGPALPSVETTLVLNSTHILARDGFGGRMQVFGAAGGPAGKIGAAGGDLVDQFMYIMVRTSQFAMTGGADHRIVVFNAAGNRAETGRPAEDTVRLDMPADAAPGPARIFVADSVNHRIQIFDAAGNHAGAFGSFGKGPGQLDMPADVALGPTRIFVADSNNNRVQAFDASGNHAGAFGSFGRGTGQFDRPMGMALSPTRIFVADSNNNRIQIFGTAGDHVETFGSFGRGPGQFYLPSDIALNSTHIFVADRGNGRIQIFKPGGDPAGTPGVDAAFGAAGAPTGNATHSGVDRATEEKRYVLDLINAERRSRGMDPVVLGDNPAAQLRADGMLEGCLAGRAGTDGLKPYMGYSLAGGYQYNSEIVHGPGRCADAGDDTGRISVEGEIRDMVDELMDEPHSRNVVLDPHNARVNIGLAWDGRNAKMVQHFEYDYVSHVRTPAIRDGVLSFSGMTANGASVWSDDDLIVQVYYDPPGRDQELGQPACAGSGDPVAMLVRPLPPGYVHMAYSDRVPAMGLLGGWSLPPGHVRMVDSTAHALEQCPNPYDASAPHSAGHADRARGDAGSRIPFSKTFIVPYHTAADWTVHGNAFFVGADVQPLLDRHGPGVYTVVVWGAVGAEKVPVLRHSVFHMTGLLGGYG